MIELDELGEMAWVPLALLAAVMAWRSRSAVLASLAGGGRLQAWRDGAASAPGSWVLVQAGSALQWMWSIRRNGGPPSGNQSFDSYRDDALRKLKEGICSTRVEGVLPAQSLLDSLVGAHAAACGGADDGAHACE